MNNGRDWLNLLEFPNLLEILATFCDTEGGKEFSSELSPISDSTELRRRLREVREMSELLTIPSFPAFDSFDVPRNVTQLCRISTYQSANLFRRLYKNIMLARDVISFFSARTSIAPSIGYLTGYFPDLTEVTDSIDNIVDARDKIRDTASREISQIRNKIASCDEEISEKLRRIARKPELKRFLQFPEPTFSGERYVIAVKSEFRSRIQGILHYTSDSGMTSFMEPYSVVDLTNDLITSREMERSEERRLLSVIGGIVNRYADEIESFFALLDYMDFLVGCAKFASEYNCIIPKISNERVLILSNARHPLLAARNKKDIAKGLTPKTVVPLSITLGSDFSMLIVTGPNTGGKTIALKTVGLLSAMALSGLPIPAEKAEIPEYRGIYSDIGDEQSIEQNLSTFSSHITRIAKIIELASQDALVLLDELGSGTDPAEGGALGQAILEHLSQNRVPTVVTTHIGQLKKIAFADKNVQNASMEFNLETLEPTYYLTIGEAGESKALQIASRLGIPQHVLERGKQLVEKKNSAQEESWKDLQKIRTELESEREAIRDQRAETAKLRDQVKRQKVELQQKIDELKAEKESLDRIFKIGDLVYVKAIRSNGEIKRINKKGIATVCIKGREISLSVSDLEPER